MAQRPRQDSPRGARRTERFVFGIPLIARAVASDWARIDELLGLTLTSVASQTDAEFEVVLAGHDRPDSWLRHADDDGRFRFLQSDWAPEEPTSRNDDGGMKKWRIKEYVQQTGGGLLMYLDADDLIDRSLVEIARAEIGPEHVGGVVADGVIVDFRTWRAAVLPDARVYDGPFHELCGSTTIGRVEPDSPEMVRQDPHEALGSHHVWPARSAELGVKLARLPAWGAYLVNTSQNHSETHGPYSEWRQELNAAIARFGEPFGPELAGRFGLPSERVASRAWIERFEDSSGPPRLG